jgi:hypothetical protein
MQNHSPIFLLSVNSQFFKKPSMVDISLIEFFLGWPAWRITQHGSTVVEVRPG